jgi:tRNA (cytidine/uridine-2'-O-)-methyltransferase
MASIALGRSNVHVVFVEPEIHWNTGNAGRSCLAVDAQLHLVGPLGFSLDAREVKRAGLDYWPKVAPRVWPSWDAFEPELTRLGRPWFFSPDAERDFWDVDFTPPCVLLFGKESVGFSDTIRERHREALIRIPQLEASIRSLNVSTCVGIALYEVARQRRHA